jgi:hypothetical protein
MLFLAPPPPQLEQLWLRMMQDAQVGCSVAAP